MKMIIAALVIIVGIAFYFWASKDRLAEKKIEGLPPTNSTEFKGPTEAPAVEGPTTAPGASVVNPQ